MSDSTFPENFYSQPTQDGDGPGASSDATPTELGDYELLKKLGEGGMGVVYLARQRSANRMVALKVIRPGSLESLGPEKQKKLLDRFRIEARAAANLDHNNIVTVYDVGEADGQRYFSMRYVAGSSLSDLLRDGPLKNRIAAQYMEPVARAVHDAHKHGVLHRDIKPQNILIDSETDSALVADFGLAKLNEQEDELTRAGEVMGTPQYMSPEQATDSAKVTAQSDVYSLGATLYHLLTGRPAFQAATPIETLRQVLDTDPVAPHDLNPAIDQDLNTICLKCLEKDPDNRYASAESLADELHRYLNGEPILARPLSPAGRLWRWSQRNPLVATLSIVAFVGLSGGLITTTIAYYKTEAAYQRSEESFRQALDMVNVFFTRVSEETLLDQPGLQPLRHDLLKQAREYYQGFLEQRSGDPEIQDKLAETLFRVGRITAEIESSEEALTYYDQALAIQRRLVTSHPNTTTHQIALTNTLNAKGQALYRTGRFDDSLRFFQESQGVRQRLHDRAPQDVEAARKLANAHMNISTALKGAATQQEQRLATLLPELETAKAKTLQKKKAVVAELLQQIDKTHVNLLQQIEIAQQIRQEVIKQHSDPRLLRDLAKGFINLGDELDRSERFEEAPDAFNKAIGVLESLIRDEPTLENQHLLHRCYLSLARTYEAESPDLAIKNHQLALDGAVSLATANPSVAEFQAIVGLIRLELGKLYINSEPQKALKTLNEAATDYRELVKQDPKTLDYQRDLLATIEQIAIANNPTADNKTTLRRELDLIRELITEFPDIDEFANAAEEVAAMLEAPEQ